MQVGDKVFWVDAIGNDYREGQLHVFIFNGVIENVEKSFPGGYYCCPSPGSTRWVQTEAVHTTFQAAKQWAVKELQRIKADCNRSINAEIKRLSA